MTRVPKTLSMVLVAMLYLVVCFTAQSSARFVPKAARHAHGSIRRTFLAKRAGTNCPEGNGSLSSFVNDEIKKLSSASALQGGQEEVKDAVVPVGNDVQRVQVRAKSDPNGASRSWSWSWSSKSSSSSSSSFSSSSSSSNHSDQKTSTTDNAGIPFDEPHEIQSIEDSGTQKQPEPVVIHTEDHSSHSQHTSESNHNETRSLKDQNGKVIQQSSNSHSSSSSSSSSYSHSMNVFHYIMSGNTQPANNPAPFSDGQVQWMQMPADFAALSVSPATGQPVARPARAETCNRRFPFTGKQFTASDQDHRFASPFSPEALDPVSKTALDLHNAERARYGLQPLEWNVELANMAACWADLKAYGHSEDHFCASGENIATGLGDPCYSDPMQGMKNAIFSFLDEDRNWAQNPHFSESNGHWTQAVWKDTRFVGCAVAQRKNFAPETGPNDQASMYVVCEYYPPGNVQGQFEHQVPAVRPLPQLRSACSANERHGS